MKTKSTKLVETITTTANVKRGEMISPQHIRLLLVAFVLTFCTACPELKPKPIPPTPAPPVPPPPNMISDVRIPIRAQAPELGEIGRDMCEYFYGEEQFSDLFYVANAKYEVWRKSLDLRLEQDKLKAALDAYYWVDAEVFVPFPPFVIHGQCGWDDEEPREVIASIESTLKWNKDWYLQADTAILPFQNPNRCLMTFRNFDVTDRLNDAARRVIERGTNKFAERLKEKSDFKARADEAWQQLQQPIDLGNRAWLLVQPRTVSAGPINVTTTTPQQIETVVGLRADPKITFGDPPPASTEPLPDLVSLPPGPSGFHVSTDVEINFDEANRILQDPASGIIGKKFTFGRRELEITGVRLYGVGQRIALELNVVGRAIPGEYPKVVDVVTALRKGFGKTRDFFEKRFFHLKGTIYIAGTPKYATDERTIFFPDAEYDIETRNVIARIANWIFRAQVTERLRQEAKIPLGPKLDALRDGLTNGLNRDLGPNAHLSGSVDSLRVELIYVDTDSLKGRVVADGKAEVTVRLP
ncbi:MAG TPA: DUF4403 family protein [Pyrinomonadaceae bacterium]|nr:DUF4403 family protein [Pyrinomonadaceae bacterium]